MSTTKSLVWVAGACVGVGGWSSQAAASGGGLVGILPREGLRAVRLGGWATCLLNASAWPGRLSGVALWRHGDGLGVGKVGVHVRANCPQPAMKAPSLYRSPCAPGLGRTAMDGMEHVQPELPNLTDCATTTTGKQHAARGSTWRTPWTCRPSLRCYRRCPRRPDVSFGCLGPVAYNPYYVCNT